MKIKIPIILIIPLIIILFIVFTIGLVYPLYFHEEKYIFIPRNLLIIDIKDNVENFEKDKLNDAYYFYSASPYARNILSNILIRKVTITGRYLGGDYEIELKTFFDLNLFDYVISKKMDQIKKESTVTELNEDEILYTDLEYNFSFIYPNGFKNIIGNNATFTIAHDTDDDKIKADRSIPVFKNLVNKENSWIMNIEIFDNTETALLDEWVEKENSKYKDFGVRTILDKRMVIDGVDAILTHKEKDNGDLSYYNSGETVIFIKDGNLFEIHTRDVDAKKVWDSFEFTK